MIVRDLMADARAVLGMCSDETVFNRLTYAVEVLANKSQWEPSLGYLDITVASGNVVTLPPMVEVPLKININNNPSFSRTRLYEFSLNGPGNDMAETTGFSWMDKGTVPVIAQPASATLLRALSSDDDNGKTLTIFGRDADGLEISDVLVINTVSQPVTANSYAIIDRIIKETTILPVSLLTSPADVVLSAYYPAETEPQYRQIRLSKAAASIRMLYRRSVLKIISEDDFIPLQSQMAILLMLRSLEHYRKAGDKADFDLAKALEEQAVQLCKEEQESRSGFDLSSTTETQTALDLSYNNSDSIIVADIYDDVAALLGPVGRAKVFDHITDSLEALNNKSQWDGMDGYIDITVDDSTVTLPRYVEVPIAVNIGGSPASMRNKWYEFHMNGPGSECCGTCSWSWDDQGDVVTLKDVSYPQQLLAIPDSVDDNGSYVRIYGYDEDDKWIRSTNPITSELDDGYWITMSTVTVVPPTNAQYVQRIERIVKDETDGFVSLQGFDEARNTINVLGYYYPDETEPTYRRIKIGGSCDWVRMRYRKRMLKVKTLTDPLHLKSKTAIMFMARAMASYKSGDLAKGKEMEDKAVIFANDEQGSRSPGITFSFQFDRNVSMASFEQGTY